MISFFVPGIPRPGGSKIAQPIYGKGGQPVIKNGRVITVAREDCAKTKDWRAVVAHKAREAYQGEPLTCALVLDVEFTLPRPKSHYGSGKNENVLKPSAPVHHCQKPDATKLLRALEDALKGICWRDDSQIVAQFVLKSWGTVPGAKVMIREADTLPMVSEDRRAWR